MDRCYVSECIAEYCGNNGETFCPECKGNMYIQEDDSSVVECECCGHTIDMEPGEDW